MCASVATPAPDVPSKTGALSSEAEMAIDETPTSLFAPWPDRLRNAAITLVLQDRGPLLGLLVECGQSFLHALVARPHDDLAKRQERDGKNKRNQVIQHTEQQLSLIHI